MGAILPFVPRAAAIKNAMPSDIRAAAIIIFPGVRYERPAAGDGSAGRTNVAAPKGKKPGPARH